MPCCFLLACLLVTCLSSISGVSPDFLYGFGVALNAHSLPHQKLHDISYGACICIYFLHLNLAASLEMVPQRTYITTQAHRYYLA
jgi:hypothetical protein